MNFIKNFIREEDGVTAIEYALIAALIAAVIGVTIKGIGSDMKGIFEKVQKVLNGTATA